MKITLERTFTFSDTVVALYKRIPKAVKTAFFSAFIAGLLIHAFALTNKIPNHDDIGQTFDTLQRNGSGRWFLFFPASFSSFASVPWINGLLTIFYISISACLVVSCFQIRGSISSALCGILMVSFPVVAATMTYLSTIDAYFFCLLLSCLAAYLASKYRFGFLPAIILIALSLGIYQAYFPVTAALMVGVLILDTLCGEQSFKRLITRSAKFIASLAAGMGLYFLIVRMSNASLTSYHGIDEMGNITLSELPHLIGRAYSNFFEFFFKNSYSFGKPYYNIIYIAAFVSLLVLCALMVAKNKVYRDVPKMILLILLLILFPLACTLIYIMVPRSVHALMIYGIAVVFLLMIAVMDMISEIKMSQVTGKLLVSVCSWILSFSLLVSFYSYFIVSNQTYFELALIYEQTYAYSVSLRSRIDEVSPTNQDTLLIFGRPDETEWIFPSGMPMLTGVNPSLISYLSYTTFLRYFVGLPNAFWIYDSDLSNFTAFEERIGVESHLAQREIETLYSLFLRMDLYPASGSVARQGNYILLKYDEPALSVELSPSVAVQRADGTHGYTEIYEVDEAIVDASDFEKHADYANLAVYGDLEGGNTYRVTIRSIEFLQGEAESATLRLYDFNKKKTVLSTPVHVDSENPCTMEFTLPVFDVSEMGLLLYAGDPGFTQGNIMRVEGITVEKWTEK